MQNLIGGRVRFQLLLKILISQRGLHFRAPAPVQLFQYPAFDIDRIALVQPEIAPRRVRYEVPRPGVGHLMGDERHQTFVAGDNSRRGKGQPGILHTAERETGRQHEYVITPPAVRPVKPLGRFEHFLHVGKLGARLLHKRWFSPNSRAWTSRLEYKVAYGERDQVGGIG